MLDNESNNGDANTEQNHDDDQQEQEQQSEIYFHCSNCLTIYQSLKDEVKSLCFPDKKFNQPLCKFFSPSNVNNDDSKSDIYTSTEKLVNSKISSSSSSSSSAAKKLLTLTNKFCTGSSRHKNACKSSLLYAKMINSINLGSLIQLITILLAIGSFLFVKRLENRVDLIEKRCSHYQHLIDILLFDLPMKISNLSPAQLSLASRTLATPSMLKSGLLKTSKSMPDIVDNVNAEFSDEIVHGGMVDDDDDVVVIKSNDNDTKTLLLNNNILTVLSNLFVDSNEKQLLSNSANKFDSQTTNNDDNDEIINMANMETERNRKFLSLIQKVSIIFSLTTKSLIQ